MERREGRLVFGDVVSGLTTKVMSEEVSHWEDSVFVEYMTYTQVFCKL